MARLRVEAPDGARRVVTRYAAPQWPNTRAGALQRLLALKHEAAGGAVPEPGRMTVADLVGQWLDGLAAAQRAPATRRLYASFARLYVVPALGAYRLRDVTPLHVTRLYAALAAHGRLRTEPVDRGQRIRDLAATGAPTDSARYKIVLGKHAAPGLHPTTIAKVHEVVRRVFDVAVRFGYLRENPARLVQAAGQAPRANVAEQQPFSEDQVARLLTAARARDATHKEPWLAAYYVLADTGCRSGECLALTWGDVSLAPPQPVLHFRRKLESARIERARFGPLKTKRPKIVRITWATANVLTAQYARQATHRRYVGARDPGPDDLVFPARISAYNPEGDRCLPTALFAYYFRQLCVECGLPADSHPHQLRHTMATLLLRRRVPLADVSARLGHSGRGITANVYAHVMGGDDGGALAELDAILPPPLPPANGGQPSLPPPPDDDGPVDAAT